MTLKKRTPKARPPPAEAQKGEGGTSSVDTVCIALDARQRVRLAEMMRREPLWGRTQCIRHLMGVVEYLEAQLAQTPAVEAYAVHHHLTLPAARRKITDWEWMVDTVMLLARERLAQLESRGKLPGQQ